MDSFFKQRFNASKCKTMLKLSIPRIKLLRNRREVQLRNMRRDIAKLLETGQEATARIRVEHIIREEKMTAAQEIVELFCELVSVRLPIIDSQRECPLDLKEAISSICFAAPRCADLPELLQVQLLFAGKYGKEFVAAATELMPECGVNRQLVELLSVRAPAPDVKLKLLKQIAEEHELDWDPSASENELLKPHEDLLDGPTQFASGSKFPLPKDKVDERTTVPQSATYEPSDSDEDFEMVDFPEVPKQPLQSKKDKVSAPEMLPFPSSAFSEIDDQEEQNLSDFNENPTHLGLKHVEEKKPVTSEDSLSKISAGSVKAKQNVPSISPSQPYEAFSVRKHNSSPPVAYGKYNNTDLQDVLAAAQAAADSAERAATAARSAASIAQLRISELVQKNNDGVSSSSVENLFHHSESKFDVPESDDLDKPVAFDQSLSPLTSPTYNESQKYTNSVYDGDHGAGQGTNRHQPQRLPSMDGYGQSVSPLTSPTYDESQKYTTSVYDDGHGAGQGTNHHQPQRLPSMDDDAYFSYPNLFNSQGPNLSREQSFTDSK